MTALAILAVLSLGSIQYADFGSSGQTSDNFFSGWFEVGGHGTSDFVFAMTLDSPTAMNFSGLLNADGPAGMASAGFSLIDSDGNYLIDLASLALRDLNFGPTMTLDAGTYFVTLYATATAPGSSIFVLTGGIAVPEPAAWVLVLWGVVVLWLAAGFPKVFRPGATR